MSAMQRVEVAGGMGAGVGVAAAAAMKTATTHTFGKQFKKAFFSLF